MKLFPKSLLKGMLPLILIICSVLGGFTSIIYRGFLYHNLEQEYIQKIHNQTAKMIIGSAIVNDLQKVKSQLYELAIAINQQKQQEIIEKAKKMIANLHELLNILENGGVFSRSLSLNMPDIDKMLLQVSYEVSHNQYYIVEILELRPELIELEEKMKRLTEITVSRDSIFRDGRLNKGAEGEGQRIRQYIKQTTPLFTRMMENSHKILFDGQKNLKLLNQESAHKLKIERRYQFYLAVLSGIIVLFLIELVLRQIFRARGVLEDTVEELEQTKVDLQFKNSKITNINNFLERQVADRTKELTKSNKKLINEVETRKKSEHRLRESQETWEKTFDAMSDIITIQNKDMCIVRGNQAARAFAGVEGDQLIGKKCYEIFYGISAPCLDCPVANAFTSNQKPTEIIETAGQERTFLVSCSPVFRQGKELQNIVHVARDITEMKKLEQQFRQSQKLEAVGTLAGGIAHDFNNILTSVLCFAETAQDSISVDCQAYDDISEVIKSSNRAAKLVKQILTLSRKGMERLEPLKPHLVIKEAIKLLRASLPATVSIEEEIDPEAGEVLADQTQIHQIIMNLCTNAFHALENEKGVLRIKLRRVELSATELAEETEVSPGPFIVLSVSDTGCGMDQAILERIFEPYFTTKDVNQGSGLGLAVIHGIVKKYKGFIRVESEPGQGTSFHIYMPALEKKACNANYTL